MRLVNSSRNGFINFYGLNYSYLVEDTDGELSYEHVLVPFVGFTSFDFETHNGVTVLNANFIPKVAGSSLVLVKQKDDFKDNLILFLYSFPVIEGGQFGTYPNTTSPRAVYRFTSGNPECGYFYEMLFVLESDIQYEIVYHSEVLSKITKMNVFWDSAKDFVSVTPSVVM